MKSPFVRAAGIAVLAFSLTVPALAAANPVAGVSTVTSQPRLIQTGARGAAGAALGPKASWIDPRFAATMATGTTPLVYVSITAANEVLAYSSTIAAPPAPEPAPVEAITGLAEPAGLAVDANGDLYVVELVTNDVKVFKPGSLTPFETLLAAPGSGTFQNVAVDARGTVYVTTSGGSVAVYRKGETTPAASMTDPALASAGGIAVDGAGNVFINYAGAISGNTQGYAVGAVPAATSIGETFFHRLTIDNAPNSPQPLGVTLDKNGDLVIADTMGLVSIYRPATQTPALSFQAVGLIENVFHVNLALTSPNNRHLFVAPHDTNTIYAYAYPSGTLETGITLPFNTVVEGLATSPAAPQGTWRPTHSLASSTSD